MVRDVPVLFLFVFVGNSLNGGDKPQLDTGWRGDLRWVSEDGCFYKKGHNADPSVVSSGLKSSSYSRLTNHRTVE